MGAVRRARDRPVPPFAAPAFRNRRIYPLTKPDLRTGKALARGYTRVGKPSSTRETTRTGAPWRDRPRESRQDRDKRRGQTDARRRSCSPSRDARRAVRHRLDLSAARVSAVARPRGSLRRTYDRPGPLQLLPLQVARAQPAARRCRAAHRKGVPEAYGALDVELSRDGAPAVPIINLNSLTLVSARTGYVVANPALDLAAVCLK